MDIKYEVRFSSSVIIRSNITGSSLMCPCCTNSTQHKISVYIRHYTSSSPLLPWQPVTSQIQVVKMCSCLKKCNSSYRPLLFSWEQQLFVLHAADLLIVCPPADLQSVWTMTCHFADYAFGSATAGGSRKRWREQDSSFRSSEEPPERRFREDAAVLSERSLSPQPSTSTPPASLEGVQLEQDIQVRVPQEPVGDSQQDDLTAPPAWPSPYGPQPGGLSPSAYNLMAEMVMAWMMDSPYNPEM
ncbi:uncharacterized protein LOC121884932 isoform X2 [Scomber scombrus]|uniref:Uncharacterized protein LOC121884932 isoform X2 n=1 Tax=Scomber scombrus TaxID=13677 RepID=A0AAV1N6J1_SCOSC